jgi:thioredoxin 1
MEKKLFGSLYKIGIVLLLVIVVAVIAVVKNKKNADSGTPGEAIGNSAMLDSIAQPDSSVKTGGPDTSAPELPQYDSVSKQVVPLPTDAAEKKPSLPADVLAMVNDEKITALKFDSIFNSLPAQAKDYYKDDKAGFLEELIIRQLLLQDARRKKIDETAEYKEDIMINVSVSKMVAGVTITEDELKDFIEQYKDQLPVKDYESVKEQIRPMAIEEKQRVVIENYINGLKSSARIVRNEAWIKTQEAQVADNPLSRALRSGNPVVADFGRGTCVPCKMMEPILKKLQKEYEGKAEILIIDVGEYAALSGKYRIQLIPTQIFFDAGGKEISRHQGFMSEEDIIAQLKKMGVE